jgi:hypothetical protein
VPYNYLNLVRNTEKYWQCVESHDKVTVTVGKMLDHIVLSGNILWYFSGDEIQKDAPPDETGAFRDDT